MFFPLRRRDGYFLLGLVAASVLALLPAAREVEIAGLALSGWAMAALMLLAPLVALVLLLTEPQAQALRPEQRAEDRAREPRG